MKHVLYTLLLGAVTMVNADNLIKSGIPHDQNKEKYVEVYGHRGARAYAPENTIPAYKTGLAVGVDWVDMDIGVTKDGVVVVDHDLWLNPDIMSKNGEFWANSKASFVNSIQGNDFNQKIQPYLVKNLTLKELQQYDAGVLNPNSPYAKYFPDQLAIKNTPKPSLQEVIDLADKITDKKIHYQIEFKNDPNKPEFTVSPKEFAEKLYAVLKNNNLVDRVEVQSFDWECLYELQKLDKHIKTAYLVGYDDKTRMLDSNPKIAGSWSGGKLLKDYNNSLPQMIKALGGACYEPEDAALTKEEVDEAHSLGLKVVTWTWPEHIGTAFDYELYEKLINWGVDGIITDDPAKLSSMLAARGYRVPRGYIIKQ